MSEVYLPEVNVSRETLERLETFRDLVLKWNPKINLVARSTLPELWERHIADSMQLYPLVSNECGKIVDFGSGGGFPALILAIMGLGEGARFHYVLVESDKRKSTFLREANRVLGLNCTIISERIEDLESLGADIVTARALADLSDLFELSAPHIGDDTRLLFLKGRSIRSELERAQKLWRFDQVLFKSKTSPDSYILKVENLGRAEN